MTDDHREVREALGAWVLGSLDGDERRRVEAHVASCPDCADEVRALSSMPGLLNRLTEEEVVGGLLVPSPGLRDRLLAEVAATELTLRTQVRRWRRAAAAAASVAAVAAVAAIVAVVGPGPDDTPDFDRVVAPAAAVAPAAEETAGEAAALAWEWGTTVEIELTALPARETYHLWAVADDGRDEQAGTWGATTSRNAIVRGASSIQRDALDRVEVRDDAGEVLVAFDF